MIDLTLDYHAHILPGCDHGCRDVETGLKQLEMAVEAGVKTVCATPHFYPHKESVEMFLGRRKAAAELLRRHRPTDRPHIRLGAEVLICEGMEKLERLPELCLEESRELLLEMPFYRWPETIWETLYRLHERQDVQLVLAHADRYPAEDIRQLIAEGIPLQLNAEALRHPLRRKRYLSWVKSGAVRYLGSDIHELGRGYRDFAKAGKFLERHACERI